MLSTQAADSPRDLQAVFETTAGSFVIQFYAEQAPAHSAKFIELVRQGYFNGTSFHSMVANGAVQGGDPETRDPAATAKYGSGGFNMGLKREISDIPLRRGTVVAFTLPDNLDGAGSQFFICVGDQLQFNGQFTPYAHVVEGMDVVDKISMTPTDERRMARERIEIKTVTIRKIPPPPPPVLPPFTSETIEELKSHQLIVETAIGNIVIEMLPDKAPNHVRHILRLASLGAFDQTAVHRVAPRFVIQLADLNTRKQPLTQSVNEYVVPIRVELNDIKHDAGVVSMARGSEPDSALTSFFIVLGPQPALDGTYTVFGRVIEGMDVVRKIESVPTEKEQPLERIDVLRMRVNRTK